MNEIMCNFQMLSNLLVHHKNMIDQYFAISYHICYYYLVGLNVKAVKSINHSNLCVHALRTFRKKANVHMSIITENTTREGTAF